MPHPLSHKNTVVWRWASHVTASYDVPGTALRKIRARGDMPNRFPTKGHMLRYLLRIGMDETTLIPHVDFLYASYSDFNVYLTRNTAPAGSPIPPEIGDPARKKAHAAGMAGGLHGKVHERVRAFVRVNSRVDFARCQLLAEANNVWSVSMCGMSPGWLVMTLNWKLRRIAEERGPEAICWPDNADVLNWEHKNNVKRVTVERQLGTPDHAAE